MRASPRGIGCHEPEARLPESREVHSCKKSKRETVSGRGERARSSKGPIENLALKKTSRIRRELVETNAIHSRLTLTALGRSRAESRLGYVENTNRCEPPAEDFITCTDRTSPAA